MIKPISLTQGWLSVEQAASYLGISRKSMDKAINIKKGEIGNHSLRINQFGNRTLSSKKSIDAIEPIFTVEKSLDKNYKTQFSFSLFNLLVPPAP